MGDFGQEFRIPRVTGTHADIMAAVGLAELLSQIPGMTRVRITEDAGSFLVALPRRISDEDIKRIPHVPGYSYLRPNVKVTVPPSVREYVDYPQEVEKVNRYFKQRAELRKKRIADAEIDQIVEQDKPLEEWELWRALNNLQGDETTNRVFLAISQMGQEEFASSISRGLTSINNREHSGLKWDITQTQIFQPASAKGYREVKPSGTSRKNFKTDNWGDPFLEWLRYRGFFAASVSHMISKDFRIHIPVPSEITVGVLKQVTRDLRQRLILGGPPKIDALMVLNLAEILIDRSLEMRGQTSDSEDRIVLSGKSPANVISGVAVTHYQSMGTGRAVTSMATMALPGWFPIRDRTDAQLWLDILDEHKRVVRGLRDNHSDEINLLIAYRRFLEKRGERATWALIEFMEHYGPFLIRAREQGRNVRSFRTDYFGRILMATSPNLVGILKNEGFIAIAAAFRQMTVSAQYWKGQSKRDRRTGYREVRYDLLPDLRRKRTVPGSDFIEAVAHYVDLFNTENAKQREREREKQEWPIPADVTTTEFAAFVSLFSTPEATPLVGALLCAYASCREPQIVPGAPPDPGDDDNEEKPE